ncbi:MAG: hypothetical protein BMS9Abin15_0840 [Gammaproteobacteria bacterium]|nr:MAG: hypothetical protein BMS9Abin15_0840 [Gammaproteobacteria bacterium]
MDGGDGATQEAKAEGGTANIDPLRGSILRGKRKLVFVFRALIILRWNYSGLILPNKNRTGWISGVPACADHPGVHECFD